MAKPISKTAPCANGGARQFNVDGSSTPEEFTAGPSGTEVWDMREIVIHTHAQSFSIADFGHDTALTNGVKFE